MPQVPRRRGDSTTKAVSAMKTPQIGLLAVFFGNFQSIHVAILPHQRPRGGIEKIDLSV